MQPTDHAVTPAVQAIRDWIDQLRDPGSALSCSAQALNAHALDPRIAGARPEDFAAAGFRFYDAQRPRSAVADWQDFVLRLDYSLDRGHQALLFEGGAHAERAWDAGPLLWIDGRPIAVPRDAEGRSLVDVGQWIDERFYAVKTGGLLDHPMSDPSQDASFDGLGKLRGLLLCDAERQIEHLVLPPPGERWTAPVAVHANGRLQVYATVEDERAHRAAWSASV